MKQNLKIHSLASVAILLSLLGPPVTLAQMNATAGRSVSTSGPRMSQTVSSIYGNAHDVTPPEQHHVLDTVITQAYDLDGQSPLSTALIVLAQEASQANLGSLTEDLNIMCRLFDRTLARAGLRSSDRGVFTHFLISHNGRVWGDRFFGNTPSRTQCLYVEGYGPLFMIGVDFPLVEGPPTRPEAEPNEPSDPVWAEVSRELHAPSGNRRPMRSAPEPTYNPEKILSLKTAITRALKHAANIRELDPEASVTILVKGRQTAHTGFTSSVGYDDRLAALYSTTERPAKTSQLVIRASVKDIKEYAAGTLSDSAFEKQIHSVLY